MVVLLLPRPQVLVLNGSHDRETSRCVAHEGPMTAVDMVQAVSERASLFFWG